jgi:hypothetical protein
MGYRQFRQPCPAEMRIAPAVNPAAGDVASNVENPAPWAARLKPRNGVFHGFREPIAGSDRCSIRAVTRLAAHGAG